MTVTPWVEGLTFGEVLKQTARRFPDHDALVFPQLDLRLPYRQFYAEVQQVARALMALGVSPGDHVGIWSTNWPQWIVLQFATAQMGAVLVNVNPAYREHELGFILKQADLHTLILTDAFKDGNYEEMLAGLVPEVKTQSCTEPLANPQFPKLRHAVSIRDETGQPGIWNWQQFLAGAERIAESELEAAGAALSAGMPVNIQYTSGTTGNPKGAMLSHRNLLLNAYYSGERMKITAADRICIPVPFYHCFGCVLGTLLCAVHGAAMVIPAEAFDPVATMRAIEQERATALYGVPTMFNAVLHAPGREQSDFSSLRTGIMAGSPCPIELMRQVTDKLNLSEMTIAYGLTEASPLITQTDVGDALELRVTTVGTAIPDVEVRIADPATGDEMPGGEQGELWSRGHNIMLGYYKNEAATQAAITEEGWLRTGDLAVMTATGHFRITGRSKDVIIRGGENIYPRDIEEFLLTHPQVRDVQVVGLPDIHYGETVSAWVVPHNESLTEDALRAYCQGKVAHFKIPKYFVLVDAYPLTVTGKIQKYRLRDEGIRRFGLEQAAGVETA